MIYTFLFIILLTCSGCFIHFLREDKLENKKEVSDITACFGGAAFLVFIVFVFSTMYVIGEVDKANSFKAQIVMMKPLELYRKDLAIAEGELVKVERLIERSVDKNQPNIEVEIKNGVKIYSLMGNSDLGSAEYGNAKKQELLLHYIEKQNDLADRLIYLKKLAYGDGYWELQQNYLVYANSILDGWIVRLFSVSEKSEAIRNSEFYPLDSGK